VLHDYGRNLAKLKNIASFGAVTEPKPNFGRFLDDDDNDDYVMIMMLVRRTR